MKRETLEKIRRLFEDKRGDPFMLEIAERILRENEPKPDEIVGFPLNSGFKDPRHPGLRPSREHVKRIFLDLERWRRTKNGNLTHSVMCGGVRYRIVLFRHKKSPTYGWMRIVCETGLAEFSKPKYHTLNEAHESAWLALTDLGIMGSTPPSTKP